MNSRIKLLQLFAAAILSILVTAACSNNDERTEFTEQINADGTYTYNIRIDCMIADSATDVTRANYSWENGTTLYLRFKNGSTYTAGTAVYNSSTGLWSLTTPSSLPVLTSESTCEAYYFKNNGSVTTSTITLTENTSCYQGTGSYTHPTGSDIYASVTLKPKNWRLRFRGSSGSSVTIVSNSSDISYYSSFNRTTGAFSTTKKDVKLTVASNGYTPYIYGTFLSPSTSNSITIKNSNDEVFSRTVNGTTLQSKSSGYLNIPSSSNYSGWTVKEEFINNCDTKVSKPLPFTDCIVTRWDVGNNVNKCYANVFTASELSGLSDNTIIARLKQTTPITSYSDLYTKPVKVIRNNYYLSPGTSYCLCTVSYKNLSQHGNLVKYYFSTNSSNLACAAVSNIYYSSNAWHWTTTSRNNAYRYKTFIYFSYKSTSFDTEKEAYDQYFQTQSDWQSRFGSWSFTINSSLLEYTRLDIFTWPVTSSGQPYGNIGYSYGTR